jgi:circadian clock protein KaiC
MINQRVPTGIAGLDEVLYGGLIAQSSYLLVGGAGTGKTILSLQWLRDAGRHSEAGLYVTLAEPGDKIERNIAGFGWRLDGLELVDLTPAAEPRAADAGEYHVFPPSEVEHVPMWQGIYEAIERHRPRRVVIDSVTQLRYLSTDEYQFRKQVLSLVNFLNRHGCTSLLVFEPSELERETSVGLAVDGIIRLRAEVSPNRVVGLRSVQVEKLRGSDFMSGLHPLRITGTGIHVFPHRIERPGGAHPAERRLASGLRELDELLGGGLDSGTVTLITGPSGVGKSTLGMQVAMQAVGRGERAVFYAFEESAESVLARSRGVGAHIEAALASGALRIVPVNPLELYPDEFLGMVRAAVEEDGCGLVVLDSLRGYYLAMEEFGSLVANIHNLVTCLNRRGVTTLLINEVEHITGNLMATELGVSYLADTIILMRYAEHAGQVIKVISCLKKRLGDFQPELRQMRVTARGIEISDKLEHLRGVLTGIPSLIAEAPNGL